MRQVVYSITCGALLAAASASSHSQTYVKVLTVVTDKAILISGINPLSVANSEISKTNQALATSGANNVRFASVGVIQTSLPIQDAGVSVFTAAGNVKILEARDATRADVVIVIHEVTGSGGSVMVPGRATKPEQAFAVVHPYSTFGSAYGYQHELAHLMGANHQSSGGVEGNSSANSVGKGWYWRHNIQHNSNPNDFHGSCMHTIMAYKPLDNLDGISCLDSVSWKQLRYSNPSQCTSAGINNTCYPWGSASANNTLVINQYGPTLFGYGNVKLAPKRKGGIMQTIINALGE